VKTSVAVTNALQLGGQFVLGAQTLPGAPYDGRSLCQRPLDSPQFRSRKTPHFAGLVISR
jgi:hypothetical protein